MTECVIFDMDGVLVDSEPFYNERRNNYLRLHGLQPLDSFCFTGSNEKAIWETLVPADPALREHMKLGYRLYRQQHPIPYETLLNPQVLPVFRALKESGLRVAIASSSDRKSIATMMRAADIEKLVDYYISGEDCSAHKPAPEIYLRALEALGLPPDNAVAVEDSPLGIASAKAAGLQVYALRPSAGSKLDQSAAYRIIDNLSDILEIVDARAAIAETTKGESICKTLHM